MMKKMSVKDKAAMATPNPLDIQRSVEPVVPTNPKTAPGGMVAFMERESNVIQENIALKEELNAWSEATPAKKIDASLIIPSKWANRHADSFNSSEFEKLKVDISEAGGNVQAIKVRPIPGANPQSYEVVFGHRRHRACVELGLPVLALIESISDQALFEQMDRENRQREDLRPYEQGEMYRKALEDGLYSSMRKMADALGLNSSNVARAIQIAEMPSEVLNAFPSRLDIQYLWSSPLNLALASDRALVIARAKEITIDKQKGIHIKATEVFNRLISKLPVNPKSGSRSVKIGDEEVMLVSQSKNKVSFEVKAFNPAVIEEIEKAILKILERQQG